MSTQISLKLSKELLERARRIIKLRGYYNLQEFIREIMREKLFEEEDLFRASMTSLAKDWESLEDEKAWSHLQ